MHQFCLGLLFFISLAVAVPDPTVQVSEVPALDGWSPAPTGGRHTGHLHLFKRQEADDDKTCGYLDGDAGTRGSIVRKLWIVLNANLQRLPFDL